jgi:hypothetical protein
VRNADIRRCAENPDILSSGPNVPNINPHGGGKPMIPKREVTVEDVIDTDIQVWKEDNADLGSSVEAEQLDLIETGEEEAITSTDYNDF